MATTWDPNSKSSTVTLSGANLVASVGSASGNVLATRPCTGPTYFEVTVGSNLTGTASIGVATRSYNFASTSILLGSDTQGCGYRSGGTVLINGATIATLAAYVATNVIGVAVNLAAQLIWFRVGTGGWNNDVIANQNPVGNVGGISLATMALGSALPAAGATFATAADAFTGGFSTFSNTAPTGYITIDTVAALANGDIQRARPSNEAGFPTYSGGHITGYVKENGSAVARTVVLYERYSGRLLDRTTSSAVDGSYSLRAYGFSNVYAVAIDDAPTAYQAQVYDQLAPL